MGCKHFLKLVTKKGAKLSHSDRVETQIEIGQGLSTEQLVESAKRAKEPLGLLLEESLIFFALLYRETYLGVQLGNVLFDRVYVRFQGRYARELCHELNQELWAQIIDPSTHSAVWAQLCFWRFALNSCRNLLKKEHRATKACSLDSERTVRLRVLNLAASGLSLEEAFYVREAMGFLTNDQRLAFQLRHEQGFSSREIGATLNCTERTVRRLLRIAEARLRISL
jgi:RNA polymerase sigma factor (sigma-70 family)